MLEVSLGAEIREEKEYNRCNVILLGISSAPPSVNCCNEVLRSDGSRLSWLHGCDLRVSPTRLSKEFERRSDSD